MLQQIKDFVLTEYEIDNSGRVISNLPDLARGLFYGDYVLYLLGESGYCDELTDNSYVFFNDDDIRNTLTTPDGEVYFEQDYIFVNSYTAKSTGSNTHHNIKVSNLKDLLEVSGYWH